MSDELVEEILRLSNIVVAGRAAKAELDKILNVVHVEQVVHLDDLSLSHTPPQAVTSDAVSTTKRKLRNEQELDKDVLACIKLNPGHVKTQIERLVKTGTDQLNPSLERLKKLGKVTTRDERRHPRGLMSTCWYTTDAAKKKTEGFELEFADGSRLGTTGPLRNGKDNHAR